MLDCKQASQLISQSLDRSLTLRERLSLKLHLFICEFCKRFSQHMQSICVALKQMTSSIESNDGIAMPSAAKSRILQSIESIKD